MDSYQAVIGYHERSKHRLEGYAPGPGGMDWANQPDPFRTFAGSPEVSLPLAADALNTSYAAVRTGQTPLALPLDLHHVAVLFELSLGLSAWKQYGRSKWALRCNPSSGNLHPTEGYLACPELPGLPAGVYHYLSRGHTLERRAAPDAQAWSGAFPAAGIIVGLSSIYWREAWKYGMRAFRYCMHDCGHAIAAVAYAAAALGWRTRVLEEWSDDDAARLLGIDRAADFALAEREQPEVLLWVGKAAARPPAAPLLLALSRAAWSGRANRLSVEPVHWADIDHVHAATSKPGTAEARREKFPELPPPARPKLDLSAAQLYRQRRSAVDFDAKTTLGAADFFAMLDALLPRNGVAPWDAAPWPPQVHLGIIVNRVTGLDPGLYVFCRNQRRLAALKQAARQDWLWRTVAGCPGHIGLYLLLPYDLRQAAKLICCHQSIAADSCFALGFLARFQDNLKAAPWRYRWLFREAGILGQALYLEAEAAGVRATGIGCFFDDEMHALLGFHSHSFQSLYHFTVGGAIEDAQLTTLPPYPRRT